MEGYKSSVKRYYWVVIACVVAAAIAGGVLSYMQPTVYHASSILLVQAGAPGTTYPGGPSYGATTSDSLSQALNYAAEIPTRSAMQYVLKFDPQLQKRGYTADDLILDVAPSTSTTSATINLLASATRPDDAVLIANGVALGFSDYIRAQGQQQLDAQRSGLTNQINSIKQQKASWEAKIAALPNNTVPQYTVYNNNLVDTTHMLDTLTAQLQTLPTAINSDVTLIQPAAPKDVTTAPRGPLIVAVSGGVGLLLGILIMSLMIVLNQQLRDEKEVKEKLGLAYLGSLPKSDDLQKAPVRLTGGLARQVEDLCANLRLTGILPGAWEAPHAAVLLVTSPRAAEGKTTVAVAIASAAASSGSRVVVVDGNPQKPSTHLAFRINPVGIGLSGLLKGGAYEAVDDVVVRSTVPGVWLLPAGAPMEGASLLLEQKFQEILRQLRQRADLIVIDGPSLLSGADASQLATMADGVALVVDARYARFSLLRRAKNLLVSLAHTHVGVVMNRSGKRGRNSYYAATYGDDALVEQADVSGGAYNGHSTGIVAQIAPFIPPSPSYSMPSPRAMPPEPSNTVPDGKNQQMVPPVFRRPQGMGE